MSAKQYVKVGPVDVAFAGKRTSVLVGPVAHRGAEYAQSAFRRIAQRGPSARVGLQPSATTNKWLFDPERCGVVSTLGEREFSEMLSEFERFTAQASCGDEPVVVTYCGNYVMLSFDHGIGDATACLELTAVAAGGDDADYLIPNTRQPLRSALIRTLTSAPRDIIEGLRSGRRSVALPTRTYPRADVKDIVMTYVRTGPDFLAAIKEMRKEHFPETSITAAVTYAVRSAFEAHGHAVTDDLSVLVDLRRFMGEDETTLANLSAVVDLTAPPALGINEFGAQFADAVKGATPLIRLAGSVAKRRILGSAKGEAVTTEWPVKTRLTFSDPTRHPSIKKVKWVDSDEPIAYVLINDPTLPHAITITAMCDVEQCFQFTASYFAGSYDRADIDRIISDIAKDPRPYLSSAAYSGAG